MKSSGTSEFWQRYRELPKPIWASGAANLSALERESPCAEVALQEGARRLFYPHRSDRLPSDCCRCAGWIFVDLDRPTRTEYERLLREITFRLFFSRQSCQQRSLRFPE